MVLGSSHNEAICLQVQADPRRCPKLLNWRKTSVYRGAKNRSANWRSRRLEVRGSQAENQADEIKCTAVITPNANISAKLWE